MEDGLVWYWNFDDDLNGTSNPVTATIGGMNGTKGSGVTVVGGKFGNALNFDGSTNANSVVSFGANSRTNFDGLFSVSLWVKRLGGYSGYGRIISTKSGFQILAILFISLLQITVYTPKGPLKADMVW